PVAGEHGRRPGRPRAPAPCAGPQAPACCTGAANVWDGGHGTVATLWHPRRRCNEATSLRCPLHNGGGTCPVAHSASMPIDSLTRLGLPGLHLRGAAIVLHPHRTIEDQGCRPPACGACSPAR